MKINQTAGLFISILLGVSIVLYLAFSFGSWNVNPGEWEDGTRWLFVSLSLFISDCITFLIVERDD